jgi:hypothetical protein
MQVFLYGNGAPHGVDRAVEIGQEGVPHGLDDPPAVLKDLTL